MNPNLHVDLRADSDATCGAIFSKNVSSQVLSAMNNLQQVKDLKKALSGDALSAQLANIPGGLSGPIETALTAGGQQVCIYPDVRKIISGAFTGPYSAVQAQLSIEAYPSLVLANPCPPAPGAPPIQVDTVNPPGPNGFAIPVALAATYSSISSELNAYLNSISPFKLDGHPISIVRADVRDAGGHVLVALQLKGFISGTVYFWGYPSVGPDGTVLGIKNVQLEVKTASLIDKIKVGLAKLLLGDIKPELESHAQFDLSNEIASIKQKISSPRKTKAGLLSLSVDRITVLPNEFFSKPSYLGAWFLVEGSHANLSRLED